MSKKDLLVLVLLVGGVAGCFVGFALISRGTTEGWLAVLAAVPLLVFARRHMRIVPASIDGESAKSPEPVGK